MTTTRPTLLNSCAYAATAAEARFRIDAPPMAPPAGRIVALDPGAAVISHELEARMWHGARFLTWVSRAPGFSGAPGDLMLADVLLGTGDGDFVRLVDELVDADFVMMIATADDGAPAASAIGTACVLRGIMTAAVVVGNGDTSAAVAALRPHARVLLVTNDERDIAEIMSAVGV